MRLSPTVLQPYFVAMSSTSVGRDADSVLRQELAAIGREAECKMQTMVRPNRSAWRGYNQSKKT